MKDNPEHRLPKAATKISLCKEWTEGNKNHFEEVILRGIPRWQLNIEK